MSDYGSSGDHRGKCIIHVSQDMLKIDYECVICGKIQINIPTAHVKVTAALLNMTMKQMGIDPTKDLVMQSVDGDTIDSLDDRTLTTDNSRLKRQFDELPVDPLTVPQLKEAMDALHPTASPWDSD